MYDYLSRASHEKLPDKMRSVDHRLSMAELEESFLKITNTNYLCNVYLKIHYM